MADIKLKNPSNIELIYENSNNIVIKDIEGIDQVFSAGSITTDLVIEPNFEHGTDQQIEESVLIKQATIKKPDSLIPNNILKGKNIAGVAGIANLLDQPIVHSVDLCINVFIEYKNGWVISDDTANGGLNITHILDKGIYDIIIYTDINNMGETKTIYECIAYSGVTPEGDEYYAIGNKLWLPDGVDTGEPFTIILRNGIASVISYQNIPYNIMVIKLRTKPKNIVPEIYSGVAINNPLSILAGFTVNLSKILNIPTGYFSNFVDEGFDKYSSKYIITAEIFRINNTRTYQDMDIPIITLVKWSNVPIITESSGKCYSIIRYNGNNVIPDGYVGEINNDSPYTQVSNSDIGGVYVEDGDLYFRVGKSDPYRYPSGNLTLSGVADMYYGQVTIIPNIYV